MILELAEGFRSKSAVSWRFGHPGQVVEAVEARERAAREGGLGNPRSFFDTSAIMDAFSHNMPNLHIPGLYGEKPDKPRPRSDEQLQADLERFREELAARWDGCTDYLASVAWPALHFRITNERYLKNVEIIVTFHKARGLEFIDPTEFQWMKLEDPSWEPGPGRTATLSLYRHCARAAKKSTGGTRTMSSS